MSFSWFIGLHFPLLLAVANGNTTLAWSIWPASHFDQATNEDEPHSALMAPMSFAHPAPQSIWYVVTFFSLLACTWVLYFTAALSYPGYVDEEYKQYRSGADGIRARGDDQGGSSSSSGGRRRNGYARVGTSAGEEDDAPPDVRVDLRATTQRVLVASAAESPVESRLGTSTIPVSAFGESVEAAELSIGCTPPIAQPILQSLGLTRAQIHAQDQTADDDNDDDAEGANPPANEIVHGEEETSRLTTPPGSAVEMSTRGASGGSNVPTTNGASVTTNANGAASPPAAATSSASAAVAASRPQSGTTGYCTMCHLVRPARSKHCYKCRHCVVKFDHHCPFVANCIGARNHRYFLSYVWCQVLVMVWSMSLNAEPYFYAYDAKEFYGHALAMLIMIGQLCVCGMLALFHTWLMTTNQTTYQVIKIQDQGLNQTPHVVEQRRLERRRQNRRMGDHSEEDEGEDEPPSVALTWHTYHLGFFWNAWTFFRGSVPEEHRLPRSILEEGGGRWVHLPHALAEVEPTAPPPFVPRLADHSGDPTARSTVVTMQLADGRTLPTTASELAAFPDTPPLEPTRVAYTRPVRIIGKSQSQAQHQQHQQRSREPDTDEDAEDRTESIAL